MASIGPVARVPSSYLELFPHASSARGSHSYTYLFTPQRLGNECGNRPSNCCYAMQNAISIITSMFLFSNGIISQKLKTWSVCVLALIKEYALIVCRSSSHFSYSNLLPCRAGSLEMSRIIPSIVTSWVTAGKVVTWGKQLQCLNGLFYSLAMDTNLCCSCLLSPLRAQLDVFSVLLLLHLKSEICWLSPYGTLRKKLWEIAILWFVAFCEIIPFHEDFSFD